MAHSTAPLELTLSRMEGVRQCGKGWRCDCPNGHKSKGALSICAADDGRVLLTCFAGCSALEVMHGAGLELADLFEKTITENMTPAQRRELRERARQSQWRAALEVLEHEATVIQIAGVQIASGEPLNPDDHARLDQAVERIASAKAVLNGRP